MRSVALVLLAFLLASTTVSAQVPTAPQASYTLTLTAPGSFGPLVANGSSTVAVGVDLVLSGVVCPQPVTIPVTLTATPKGAPAFLKVTLEPSVINVSIAQGPQGIGPTAPGGGKGDAQLKATIVGNITANASVGVDVAATAPAPACQPAPSGATSNTATVFANMTAPPPPPPEPAPAKKGFLPGPGALVGVLAALVVAGALRRKG